jgi:ComF family protein
VRAAYQYGGPAADAVMRLKYGQKPHIASHLSGVLVSLLDGVGEIDLVVPVPLHVRRLRRRGFNQSALLAAPVAASLGLPLETRAVLRVRDTDAQAGQSRAARCENIKGAFSVVRPSRLAGNRVLLVDDVVTTGTTAREIASVMLRAGAESIVVLAFARAR